MRRLLAGAGALGAAVLVLGAPLHAQGGAPPDGFTFFSVRALADGVTAELTVDALLPVDEIVGLSSVTSEAHLGLGRSDALAALPDPGDLVLTLPGTLSGLSGVSGLPDYPAASRAEHPAVPEDEVVFAPDAGLGAGRLRTHATEDTSGASAAVTDLRDTVGLLPGLSIGSIRTESTTERLDASSYRAVAVSTISDLRLLDGLVRIDEVTTEVTAEVLRGRFAAHAPTVHVAGVEIAGTPVAVGRGGITGLGQDQALGPVVEQLARPLSERGIDIRTVPAGETVEDGRAVATGSVLTIEAPLDVQGRPGRFALTLGRTSASVEAGGGEGSDLAIGVGTPASPAGATVLPASPLRPAPSSTTGGARPSTGGPTSRVAPTGAPAEHLVALPAAQPVTDWHVAAAYRAVAAGAVLVLLSTGAIRRLASPARSDLRSLWRW